MKQSTKNTNKRKQNTCYCDAYKFPHRKYSGACNGEHYKESTGRHWSFTYADEVGVSATGSI